MPERSGNTQRETKALCGAHALIPFVEFNCAEYADNPQLLLSHLFGYKKGAFTGALEDKPGLVEQANGGILFLDEIHGLSSTGQEMFFSLLDTGVFRRVGDNTPRTSRFMLIGATTKPLTDLLETFLRRMPVLISMPTLSDRPMKERLELVEHFFTQRRPPTSAARCASRRAPSTAFWTIRCIPIWAF